jgi:TolB protein
VKYVCLALAAVLATTQTPATQTAPAQPRPAYRSTIHIHDLAGNTSQVLHEADGVWEAPNWSRDGRHLLVNSGGRLYRIPVDGSSAPEPLPIDASIRANNDHDYSADGTLLAISASSPASRQSQIYVANAEGSNLRLVVNAAPSYFHGWSPDGRHLAFVANRDGTQYDVYRVSVAGGEEQRLTFDAAADDGPDYSPDGRWIYFNSNRGGGWNVWRMPADGAGPGDARAERVTGDALEDWFPHPSPDGTLLLFLSFPAGTRGHDERTARVQLRTIPAPGDRIAPAVPKTVLEITGGQGTINVNSWAPDSKRFAYVSYQAVPRQ